MPDEFAHLALGQARSPSTSSILPNFNGMPGRYAIEIPIRSLLCGRSAGNVFIERQESSQPVYIAGMKLKPPLANISSEAARHSGGSKGRA